MVWGSVKWEFKESYNSKILEDSGVLLVQPFLCTSDVCASRFDFFYVHLASELADFFYVYLNPQLQPPTPPAPTMAAAGEGR